MLGWHLKIIVIFTIVTRYSAQSIESSSSCSIPDCRYCDILDPIKCTCTKLNLTCDIGFSLSDDGCSCVELIPSSQICPGLICAPDLHINEARCECTDKICETFAPCPENTVIDLETCECVCNKTALICPSNNVLDEQMCQCKCSLNESECPPYYIFDPFNCICRHPPCDPPGPCPKNTDWNSEKCSCECKFKEICESNHFFDPLECKCKDVFSWGSSGLSSSYDSQSPSLTCSPSDSICKKWCDIFDYETCQCYEVAYSCVIGSVPRPDGCGCTDPSYSESSIPSCELSQDLCPPNHIFDEVNCICRNPFCAKSSFCPEKSYWDPELCKCVCYFNSSDCASLGENFYFDEAICDCNYRSVSSWFDHSYSSCSIPSCRWCDTMDYQSCTCNKIYVDCLPGYQLSSDGCSCEKLPETAVSSEELSSSESSIDFSGSTSSSVSSCNLPSCRWCDILDEVNCVCYQRVVDCAPGYDLTQDGCECVESNITLSSSFSESESSSSCDLSDCRSCDYKDYENCFCYILYVDCFFGYELSADGCECVKSNTTSENCFGVFCPPGTYIDETRCECLNDACKSEPSCPENLLMDASSCECFCNVSPWMCPFSFEFDEENCRCKHSSCDIIATCRENQLWDQEECKCLCIENKLCARNFTWDSETCECICDPKLLNTTCPSGMVFDSLQCKCIEDIECYDFNDPECACDCLEILECNGKLEFDLDYCQCMCPYDIECQKGFEMSEDTCECVQMYS